MPPRLLSVSSFSRMITRTTWLTGKSFVKASGSSSLPSGVTLHGNSYAFTLHSLRLGQLGLASPAPGPSKDTLNPVFVCRR
jgi:hypothetical protein